MNTLIGLCELKLYLPEAASLKDKRATIKSAIKRLHNTFNVSVAEVGQHDKWQTAEIAIVVVSNSATHSREVIQKAIQYIEEHYLQLQILDQKIEII
jgi:uncharacterized protein YlxP (DUF503 family)